MPKQSGAPALPPGTEALFSVQCKDVVLGRGSGTQNHCGNVTYRKLVFLNKELYATSSKFDKLKISKAIVAAVREFGGHFVQADEKRGGLYFDIGDKRAWDKTSQALREGQADIRAKLAEEDPSGMSKMAEYERVISEQTFFAYACRMMESLYHPVEDGGAGSGSTACGQMCPHAKRRQTLNQLGANPMQIHNAMQSIAMPPLPPPQQSNMQQHQQQQLQGYQQPVQSYNTGMVSPGGTHGNMPPLPQTYHQQPDLNSFEPLPYNAPVPEAGDFSPLDPLPFAPEPTTYHSQPQPMNTPAAPPNAYPNTLAPSSDLEPLPYAMPDLQKPSLGLSDRGASGGTVFSLRKFCSEDFEMSSSEGKMLMEQLNQEVDDLIRRKSYGLIQIDTKQAFEDLVFEEDSMMMDEPKVEEDYPPIAPAASGANSRKSAASTSSGKSSAASRLSGLSFKDDISLMNMSILTLEEKDESGSSGPSNKEGSTIDSTPKSIIRQYNDTIPKDIRKRGSTRVSFAGRNISLMSMDEKSFSQLVDTISDPENKDDYVNQERNMSGLSSCGLTVDSDQHSISRKMGFPMRSTAVKKLQADENGLPPTEVGNKDESPQEKVSSLTISEEFAVKSEGDFTKLAGRVDNPGGMANSLKLDMSINAPNVSAMNMSNISLSDDIDQELLK